MFHVKHRKALYVITVKPISIKRDTMTIRKPNDTPIECFAMEVNGCPVEIIRYDGDNKTVSVAIGGHLGSMKIMSADKVKEYIANFFQPK